MSSKSKYTEVQAERLVEIYSEYDSNRMSEVQAIFNGEFEVEFTIPSLRGKLMSTQDADGNSVYVPMVKVEKAKADTGPTKKEILARFQVIVGEAFDVYKLQGATKEGIENFEAYVIELKAANA
jgi:hypothetical protein